MTSTVKSHILTQTEAPQAAVFPLYSLVQVLTLSYLSQVVYDLRDFNILCLYVSYGNILWISAQPIFHMVPLFQSHWFLLP